VDDDCYWDQKLLHPDTLSVFPLQTLTAHEAAVQVLCMNGPGNLLFSGDVQGKILIWARSEGGRGPWNKKGLMRISTQPGITSLVWSEHRGVLFSGSLDGYIREWKYTEKRCSSKVKQPAGPVTCMIEYSCFLAAGHAGGDLSLVKQEDLLPLRVAHGAHSRKVTAMAISTHKLFTASHDCGIKVWLLPNVECLTTLIGHYSRIEALALSTDHLRLYSGSSDMSVMSWDILGKAVEQGFVEHTDAVTSLATVVCAGSGADDDEGQGRFFLFSGSSDCTVQVWKSRAPPLPSQVVQQRRSSSVTGEATNRET
jgi:WD40 repeat protein